MTIPADLVVGDDIIVVLYVASQVLGAYECSRVKTWKDWETYSCSSFDMISTFADSIRNPEVVSTHSNFGPSFQVFKGHITNLVQVRFGSTQGVSVRQNYNPSISFELPSFL
jgi:hypothetical protein